MFNPAVSALRMVVLQGLMEDDEEEREEKKQKELEKIFGKSIDKESEK